MHDIKEQYGGDLRHRRTTGMMSAWQEEDDKRIEKGTAAMDGTNPEFDFWVDSMLWIRSRLAKLSRILAVSDMISMNLLMIYRVGTERKKIIERFVLFSPSRLHAKTVVDCIENVKIIVGLNSMNKWMIDTLARISSTRAKLMMIRHDRHWFEIDNIPLTL